MKQFLNIVKIGGHIIDDPKALQNFLVNFTALQGPKILVHGGGKSATALSSKMGLNVQMIDGRRITDANTLELITMVYSGKINTSLVANLQALGCDAIGCSGADANCIQSRKRTVSEIDYGYVGDIQSINSDYISLLLKSEFTPVFSAITHDKKGQLLNTNADTIATAIAVALASYFDTTLYYCFEKPGVLKDKDKADSVIEFINKETYKELLNTGVISDGMLPKLKNCFEALVQGVSKVCIGQSEMLSKVSNSYTTITL